MNNELEQTVKISASQIDFNARVGVIQALGLFQDNMCEFYKNISCDGIFLVPRCHAFWVVTKTKICFNNPINWLDIVSIKTNICKLSNVRNVLCGGLFDGDNSSIDCLQELCCMDSETRRLRMVDSIPYFPKDLAVVDCYNDLQFDKLLCDFDESDMVFEMKVTTSNLDYYGHTNNVEYAKILLQTFDFDFLKKMSVEEFEIHYLKETCLGDLLKIYKKQVDNSIMFLIKKDNEVILKAKLKYEINDN